MIAVLHEDILEESKKTIQCLEHLSTCSLKLVPKSESYNRRILYVYKKIGGKIIKQVKEKHNIIYSYTKKMQIHFLE